MGVAPFERTPAASPATVLTKTLHSFAVDQVAGAATIASGGDAERSATRIIEVRDEGGMLRVHVIESAAMDEPAQRPEQQARAATVSRRPWRNTSPRRRASSQSSRLTEKMYTILARGDRVTQQLDPSVGRHEFAVSHVPRRSYVRECAVTNSRKRVCG
jgi:hypothetical protein